MGYLDDAIREHLELKRRRGAPRGELEKAEAEAFGPVGRAAAADADGVEEAPSSSLDADWDATAARAEALARGGSSDAPAGDAPDAARDLESPQPAPDDEAPPHGDPLIGDDEVEPSAERDRLREAPADPAPPHGDPFEDEPEGRSRPLAEPLEDDDPVDQPTSTYAVDQLDDSLAPSGARERSDAPSGRRERGGDEDDREAVERAWRGEERPGARRATDADADADADAAEGDDVLEETPEFLQETPEHDRLWFEQKPPKDFDF